MIGFTGLYYMYKGLNGWVDTIVRLNDGKRLN